MSGNVAHIIQEAHFPPPRTNTPARITCSCAVRLEAMPTVSGFGKDPHQPIADEWFRHRRSVGLPVHDKGPISDGTPNAFTRDNSRRHVA